MGVMVRAMQRGDLAAVYGLQCRAYPACYHEPVAALRSHLEAGAGYCFVAEHAGHVQAYVFAHPWLGAPPPLHKALVLPRGVPDHLFMHDLAVCPTGRGKALGAHLFRAVVASAQRAGLARLRLVAVGQARSYWRRLGFVPESEGRVHGSYGQAVLMQQELSLGREHESTHGLMPSVAADPVLGRQGRSVSG